MNNNELSKVLYETSFHLKNMINEIEKALSNIRNDEDKMLESYLKSDEEKKSLSIMFIDYKQSLEDTIKKLNDLLANIP